MASSPRDDSAAARATSPGEATHDVVLHGAVQHGSGRVGGRRRQLALAVFVGLVIFQLCAVYWPRVDVQGPVAWTDKVVHVLLFLAPTVAGLLAGVRPAYVVAALSLHAPVSELVQHYLLPDRSGDAWDAIADLSGVVLGATSVVVGRALWHW